MNNTEILQNLIDIIKCQNSFSEEDIALLKGINHIINERWITVKPHGDDSDDYRRLKLEDGETPKEAIDRVYKKEDKKEKTEDELKAEKKQLYQDILKAKSKGDKERHHKLLERYYEIDSILKGEEKPEEKKENKEASGNGLLPAYSKDFQEKREQEAKAKEKWLKIQAEAKEQIENNKEVKELEKQISEIYAKLRTTRWGEESQALINEKNKLISQKNAICDSYYEASNDAYKEYAALDTSTDKKDVIRQMTGDIKKQISKISSNNNALLKKIDKLDTSEYDKLTADDKKFDEQQNTIVKQMRELEYTDPKRVALKAQFTDIANKRGEIAKKQRELKYKMAVEVGKLLQVENGVKLNTHCSPAMQDITNKLKECLDGVIPSSNFNNAEMKVQKHGGRAYQSGSTIHISSEAKIETAIHETMHHLEEHSDHVLMNSLAFAASRTEGEKQESLKRLTGLNYKRDEVCKKDNFFNPYCGKLYDQFGGKNKTFAVATASEIMSMGVQELFTNPKEFAKNDREYFDFVVANLQGKLWS